MVMESLINKLAGGDINKKIEEARDVFNSVHNQHFEDHKAIAEILMNILEEQKKINEEIKKLKQ